MGGQARLRLEAKSYLEAERFDVDASARDGLLMGERPSVAGGTERMFVWALDPDSPEELRAQERTLIRRFGEVNDAYPTADKVLLLSSLEGLSAELRRDAR